MHDDRLPILTVEEAHVLLDVLADAAEYDGDALWLLGEIAARVPAREGV